jgi:hypothetical protein
VADGKQRDFGTSEEAVDSDEQDYQRQANRGGVHASEI